SSAVSSCVSEALPPPPITAATNDWNDVRSSRPPATIDACEAGSLPRRPKSLGRCAEKARSSVEPCLTSRRSLSSGRPCAAPMSTLSCSHASAPERSWSSTAAYMRTNGCCAPLSGCDASMVLAAISCGPKAAQTGGTKSVACTPLSADGAGSRCKPATKATASLPPTSAWPRRACTTSAVPWRLARSAARSRTVTASTTGGAIFCGSSTTARSGRSSATPSRDGAPRSRPSSVGRTTSAGGSATPAPSVVSALAHAAYSAVGDATSATPKTSAGWAESAGRAAAATVAAPRVRQKASTRMERSFADHGYHEAVAAAPSIATAREEAHSLERRDDGAADGADHRQLEADGAGELPGHVRRHDAVVGRGGGARDRQGRRGDGAGRRRGLHAEAGDHDGSGADGVGLAGIERADHRLGVAGCAVGADLRAADVHRAPHRAVRVGAAEAVDAARHASRRVHARVARERRVAAGHRAQDPIVERSDVGHRRVVGRADAGAAVEVGEAGDAAHHGAAVLD